MFRRWLIRVCFMLPILACAAGWVWSATHYGLISMGNGSYWVEGSATQGGIEVSCGTGKGRFDGWYCGGGDSVFEAHFWPTNGARYYLGFLCGHYYNKDGTSVSYLEVPFWFLLVVFSALLFLVWRKTAPPRSARAFPVEPSQSAPAGAA